MTSPTDEPFPNRAGSDAATRSVKSQILRALHLASPKTLPVTSGGAGPTYFAPPGAVEGMEAPLLFTFRELQVITGGFSDELLIGEGGFGKVYRAGIKDQAVAVKRLEKQAAFPGKHVSGLKTIRLAAGRTGWKFFMKRLFVKC